MYPELAVLRDGEGNWRGEADEGQRLEGGGEGEEDGGKERVALRRLAVAATEMEGHHHHHHSGGVDDGGGSKTVAVADDAVAALEPAPAPQTTTTSRTYLAQEHATRPPSEEEEPSSRKSLNAASESCTPRIMSNTPNVSESRPSLHPGQSPARLETDTAVSHSLEVSLASPFQHLQPSSEALPDAVPAPSGFADGLGLSELQLFNANANGHAQPQAQQQHQTPPQSRKPEHQPGAHTHNEPTRPTPDSGAPVVSAPPAALLLPRHVVSVLTTQGLTRIETAEEWECVKEHVGYAVWAEGRVSVVIEVGVGV